LAPINAKPPRYVFDNLISAADWLTRALDIQGYRIDDVKGLSTDFLLPFLNSPSLAGKFAVGEFFDGNQLLVSGWIFNPTGMRGRSSAFDFPLKFLLNSMCNNPGRFSMADLDHAGLVGISPFNAVTFVENHDTDLSPSGRIITNKILGYAYILTSEGYPCVYYRDYSTDKNCFGLKPLIDNLIWIHETISAGPTQQRWKDFNVFAYERLGGPHLLVGLNNDPGAPRTINVATGFGSNVTLHDYTGHAPNVVTDGAGSVSITIPRNINGLGYVCYSRDGLGGGFHVTSRSVTQDFEGAPDLDIPPTRSDGTIQVGRIWCATSAPIEAVLRPDLTGWTDATTIKMEVVSPDGTVRASQVASRSTPQGTRLQTTAQAAGFHTLRLTASRTPVANARPAYALSATYTAPQVLSERTQVPSPVADPRVKGQWGPRFSLANVAIHCHVLPSGKVLYWGRRKVPGATAFPTLNEHISFPFIWDPATNTSTPTPSPTSLDGQTVNLFCSGHTFLPDGRLMVVGGHLLDSEGVNQSAVYDANANTWTPVQPMNEGRWYPTAVTLPDGSVLVCSGSFLDPASNQKPINNIPQVWSGGPWQSITDFNQDGRSILPLFPRMHVAPDGRVFMSGGLAESFFLDPKNGGTWIPSASRAAGGRDYAPSVMYDAGKIVFIGGGLESNSMAPTSTVEVIDLNVPTPVWRQAAPMHFPRRQHNATLLPDGTVLVTGGTQGAGFNNLDPGQPVHTAELWDPATGQWTLLAEEEVDRCYHSTAVLLPDGRVLSAGGGEYAPTPGTVNDPAATHADAQLFSPPYLFKGPRPNLTQAPPSVTYGQSFDVGTPDSRQIAQVSWTRLPSVTHSFDQNQRINFLTFTPGPDKVTVKAPENANLCPPGHYMLFLLNREKVPSVARIVRIDGAASPAAASARAAAQTIRLPVVGVSPVEKDAAIVRNATRSAVVVGVTPTCPYGISACWGGAHEALQHMHGVDVVRPIPNAEDSTAYLYLKHDGLPDIDLWPEQFARIANGTHLFRGVEVTLQGAVQVDRGLLLLSGNDVRPSVVLAPLQAMNKIQWNHQTAAPWPLLPDEQTAYQRLAENLRNAAGPLHVTVTGPLKKEGHAFRLEVRQFKG
jgi:hypothetical protein